VIVSVAPDSVEKPVRDATPVKFFVELSSRIRNSWFASKFPAIAISIVFVAMFVAFVATACARLPLLYDGSHYLVRILEYNSPCTPYLRYSLAAFHYPVLLAAKLTGQLAPAISLFSVLFSCGPILAITLSWFLIRASKPGLIVWPMISVGLMSIFAQSFRMGECLFACELAWPLLLGVMVPLTPLRAVSFVVLALFLAFLHPVAIAFLGVTAIVATARALVSRKNGTDTWKSNGKLLLTVAFVVIAIVAIRLFMAALHTNQYEARELAPARLLAYIRYVVTVPLAPISASLAILGGFLFLVSTRMRNLMVARTSLVLSCVLVLISGGLAVFWSNYFVLWTQSWFYLRFLFLLLLPIMGFAIIDSFSSPKLNISRSLLSVACGIFFAVAACIHWNVLWDYDLKLRADMDASPDPVMNMKDYSWGKLSPFAHWGMPSYSIVFQGRKPEKIVLLPRQLPDAENGIIRLAPWDPPFPNLWFQLPDTRTSKKSDARNSAPTTQPQYDTMPVR
jgi:hypothetical protein